MALRQLKNENPAAFTAVKHLEKVVEELKSLNLSFSDTEKQSVLAHSQVVQGQLQEYIRKNDLRIEQIEKTAEQREKRREQIFDIIDEKLDRLTEVRREQQG